VDKPGDKNIDEREYQHHKNPASDESIDAVDYKHDEEPACFHAGGKLPEQSADHDDGGLTKFWNESGSHKPSERMDMSPQKARTILHDKSVRGHPLTPAQRGLFGAIAGKGK